VISAGRWRKRKKHAKTKVKPGQGDKGDEQIRKER
jgi:hypothetical protein